MERSEGEPKISIPPSAIAKCSVRLMSKETPFSHVPSLVILNSATVSRLNPPVVVSLLASTHTHKKPLFTYYTRTCRNVCMYVCQSGRLGCETCAQRPAKIPWMLRGRGDIHFYFYGIVLPFSACLLSVIFLCFFTI